MYIPLNIRGIITVVDSSRVSNTKVCALTACLRNGVECARVVWLLKLGAK
jgi:G3E family GTPase